MGTFEEQLRVHKLALETRFGELISVQDAVLPRLIEYAATVVNEHLVGKNERLGS